MPTTPRHLSVSAIECYGQCPAAFERRYIHGVVDPPSPAMAFGRAMAKALEAEHRGQDGDVAWIKAYSAEVLEHPSAPSCEHGLRLLAAYREHGVVVGAPEQKFLVHLPNREAVPLPLLGFIDVAGPTDLVEFKTTARNWTQGDVDGSAQATLYSYAYYQLFGRKPECVRFIIMHTRRVEVRELRAYPAHGALHLFELRAAMVLRAIRAGEFPARCRKPWCAACVEAGVVKQATTPNTVLELRANTQDGS